MRARTLKPAGDEKRLTDGESADVESYSAKGKGQPDTSKLSLPQTRSAEMESSRMQRHRGGMKVTSVSSVVVLSALILGFAFLQHQMTVKAISRQVTHQKETAASVKNLHDRLADELEQKEKRIRELEKTVKEANDAERVSMQQVVQQSELLALKEIELAQKKLLVTSLQQDIEKLQFKAEVRQQKMDAASSERDIALERAKAAEEKAAHMESKVPKDDGITKDGSVPRKSSPEKERDMSPRASAAHFSSQELETNPIVSKLVRTSKDPFSYTNEYAFNPVTLETAYSHHPIFSLFSIWKGPFEEGALVDWLGVRTKYSYDCGPNNGGYLKYVPSRRIPCHMHEGMLSTITPGEQIEGYMPLVDDEYPEYIDVLETVARANDFYVIGELGARYGTWGARAILAHRKLQLEGRQRFIGVEPVTDVWVRDHCEFNSIKPQDCLVTKGIINSTEDLMGVLNQAPHFDMLDLDCQGGERYAFGDKEPDSKVFQANKTIIDVITQKVKRLHIGTHAAYIHTDLELTFRKLGWYKTMDFIRNTNYHKCDMSVSDVEEPFSVAPKCLTPTPWGPIYVRDGLLGFVNPQFATESDKERAELLAESGGGMVGRAQESQKATTTATQHLSPVELEELGDGVETTHELSQIVSEENSQELPLTFNPLDPFAKKEHHPIFKKFPAVTTEFEEGYLVDFLGVRTKYNFDCGENNGGYLKYVPSRRVPCQEFETMLQSPPLQAKGYLPVIDDEYPEYIDVLETVVRSDDRYVIGEIGARYGTWGVRAVLAHRMTHPNSHASFIGVEPTTDVWVHQHCKNNFIPAEDCIVSKMLMNTTEDLLYILNQAPMFDMLDLDCQGCERYVFGDRLAGTDTYQGNDTILGVLFSKVKRLHIGTHAAYIHTDLAKYFRSVGWIQTMDFPRNPKYHHCDMSVSDVSEQFSVAPSCLYHTVFGPIYVRDGLLGFINPKFAYEGDREKYETEMLRDLSSQPVSTNIGHDESQKERAQEITTSDGLETLEDDKVDSTNIGQDYSMAVTKGTKEMPVEYLQLVDTEWVPNPLIPERQIHHNEVFSKIPQWEGSFEMDYLIDFLGVRTKYFYDCGPNNGGYLKYVPSRRLPCRMHEILQQSPPAHPIKGYMPLVDDEYPEYIDMLETVVRAGSHFVIGELGARYGTWGVRGVAAYRRINPQGTYTYIGVEPVTDVWVREHCQNNGISESSCLVTKGIINSTDDLLAVLAKEEHFDFLDLDCQGGERYAFGDRIPGTDEFVKDETVFTELSKKVMRIHIGTHAAYIHTDLMKLFTSIGWKNTMDFPRNPNYSKCDRTVSEVDEPFSVAESCLSDSDYGSIYVRDGLLGFINPRFDNSYEQ